MAAYKGKRIRKAAVGKLTKPKDQSETSETPAVPLGQMSVGEFGRLSKEDQAPRVREMSDHDFERLLAEHFKYCYLFALKTLHNPDVATEVVDKALFGAWKSRRRFRGEAKFKTWLISILQNQIRWHLSKQARRPREASLDQPAESNKFQQVEDNCESPSARMEGRESRHQTCSAVAQALNALPQDWREVVVRKYWDCMSVADIACLLNVDRTTVWRRLKRAIERLRENDCLRAQYQDLAPPALLAEDVNDEKTEPNDEKEPRT